MSLVTVMTQIMRSWINISEDDWDSNDGTVDDGDLVQNDDKTVMNFL